MSPVMSKRMTVSTTSPAPVKLPENKIDQEIEEKIALLGTCSSKLESLEQQER